MPIGTKSYPASQEQKRNTVSACDYRGFPLRSFQAYLGDAMSEILFQSGDITVTRSLAKFGNSTYPIANIGSVIVADEVSGVAGWVILIGIGVAIWIGIATHWVAGIAVAIGAFVLAGRIPGSKKLTLKTSSGDVTALQSKDTQLVESVRSAIEQAFAR